MSELEDAISSVLNDPEQLARISAMAQSLMGGAPQPGAAGAQDADAPSSTGLGSILKDLPGLDLSSLSKLLQGGGAKSPRLAALEALAACLDEKRGKKLSRAIRLARLASLAKLGLESGEAGHV